MPKSGQDEQEAPPVLVAGSCVVLGARAVLIRGASGSGKSTLVRALIEDPAPFPFARLVADDQTLVQVAGGRLVASPPPAIAGRLEIRGLGLCRLPFEPAACIALLADLVPAADSPRLPTPQDLRASLAGVALPRLALAERDANAPAMLRRAFAHLAAGCDLADFGQ